MKKHAESLNTLQNNIGYKFKDIELLRTAITHSSYANEKKTEDGTSNERLEFLGDSVLSFIISRILYLEFPDLSEGELSKTRSAIVCEDSLFVCAKKLNLSVAIRLGKGEESSGGRNRKSILADAFEAVIGAVFLDGGYESADKFIINIMQDNIDKGVESQISHDHKTRLQELLQKSGNAGISYVVLREKGPDHEKIFEVAVFVNGIEAGRGHGNSKKTAEQAAAGKALEYYSKKDI